MLRTLDLVNRNLIVRWFDLVVQRRTEGVVTTDERVRLGPLVVRHGIDLDE